MPAEWRPGAVGISEGTLLSGLLLLVRMSALVGMAGFPGFRNAPATPRILLVIGLTVAAWPITRTPEPGTTLAALGGELLLGLMAGVVVTWLQEAFVLGFQLIGGQAGFSYASTIDPTSQADSTVLPLLAQLCAGVLLFASGLDRELIAAIAAGPRPYALGAFTPDARHLGLIADWTAGALVVAVRLALPVFTLLLMTDLALALLSRLQAQLQLLSLAFPLKILAALVLVSWLMPAMAALYGRHSVKAIDAVRQLAASPTGGR
ncbi:MAG: flagellar biosynthetic protein FliR [Bryobacteraceae bacterium]